MQPQELTYRVDGHQSVTKHLNASIDAEFDSHLLTDLAHLREPLVLGGFGKTDVYLVLLHSIMQG